MSTKPATSRPVPSTKQPATPKPSPTRPGVMIIEDLDPPRVSPAQATPIEGAAYGLGVRHFPASGPTGEKYIAFIFERWTGLREGDEYGVTMGGITPPPKTVEAGEVGGQRFFFDFPYASLKVNPAKGFAFIPDVYGEVVRVGSGTPSTSPPQTVLVKETYPGGEDDRPFEPWHSKLQLTLSDTIIGVGQSVTATIKAWENMRVNDLVMCFVGGSRFEVAPIPPGQVGLDLTFEIDAAFFQAIGSGHYPVSFFLYDEVGTSSGPSQPWCKPVPLEVNLNVTLLDEPFIIEADPTLMVLDADALGREPAHAEVEIRRGGPFLVGDTVLLTVEGTTPDGVFVSESLSLPVTRVPDYLEFPIRNELVRSLLLSQMTVSYVRQRAGLDDTPSRRVTVAVVGRRYELPAPSVREAHGPFIEPDLTRITVEMPDYQPPGTAGDSLEVVLQGFHVDNTSERVSSLRLAGNPPRLREFPTSEYMRLDGLRDTNVHYIVNGLISPGVVGTRESDRRWVQIGRPPRDLPAPVIREAVDGNVDPTTFGEVGTLELRTQLRQGDIVSILYTGSLGGVEEQYFQLFVDAPDPALVDIPRQWFLDNLDGTLTVSYFVLRPSGAYQYSEELVVTVGTALGELFLPEVLQATIEPDELDPALAWPGGATVRVRYDFIKPGDQIRLAWKGLLDAGTYYEVKDNQTGNYVDFTVPTDVIGYSIHPNGRQIHVSFEVIRNGFTRPSPVLSLQLLVLRHLAGPVIDSIGDSVVLEVPLLRDFDETRVPAWSYAHEGQRMWLHYHGIRSNGAVYDNFVYRGRDVIEQEVNFGVTSETPVLALRDLEDWSALAISFWVTFNHSGNYLNDGVLFDVRHHLIQKQRNIFPHPEIQGATPPTGELVSIDPLAVENDCRVLVRYPNMNQGGVDQITLHWVYPDGTLADISPRSGLDGGEVVFNISNAVLARSVDSTIQLEYTVILGRGGSGESEIQTVLVGTILPADLPQPLLNRLAPGSTVTPSSLPGDAVASVQKWRLSDEGQRVWMVFSSPGVEPLQILDAYPITQPEAANGLDNIAVLRSWLLAVPNGGIASLAMKATFNGSADDSLAVAFPVTQYTISHVDELVMDERAVSLAGRLYVMQGHTALPNYGAGTSIRRVPTGGVQPYTYHSSNTAVAVVDSTGLVTKRGNGSTIITVTDRSVPVQTRKYTVTASGVLTCVFLGLGDYGQMTNAARNNGGRLPSLTELRELQAGFGNRFPWHDYLFWSSTWSKREWFVDFYYCRRNTGHEISIKNLAFHQAYGMAVR